MSNPNVQAEKIIQRETEAQTKQTLVALNELELLPDVFCHRGPNGLDEEHVADLFESLIMEGLQVPVEFTTDPDDRKVLTKGHRRVTACRILARRNTPNFTLDMKVPAIEVLQAPTTDLVVRSVMDNCQRQTLDNVDRIRAALALHQNRVEDTHSSIIR
jgi:ParB-like chromosome segregation protein Spo0J